MGKVREKDRAEPSGEPEHIRTANQSGFPLQIAVAQAVRTRTDLGWSVYCQEHAWKSRREPAESGFIDLVIEKLNVFLVIECKRVRDTTWVFLIDDQKQLSRRQATGWVLVEEEHSHFKRYGWHDLSLSPRSPQSTFCAVRGQEPNGKGMLERVASELVTATEAFAIAHGGVRANDLDRTRRWYFNVVVTTAKLAVCVFEPGDIELASGEISSAQTMEVPYVRFRKQLSTESAGIQQDITYSDFGQENENTVFVVNAEHIAAFLSEFEVDASAIAKCM